MARDPDAWEDHVIVNVHALFDDAGIPDKDADDRNLGLLGRARWVLERLAKLEADLA